MTLPVADRKICPACLLRLAAVTVVLAAAWNRHRRKAAARPPRKTGQHAGANHWSEPPGTHAGHYPSCRTYIVRRLKIGT